MPTSTFELALYLFPVLAVCGGLFVVIVGCMRAKDCCPECIGPVVPGETYCAKCRPVARIRGLVA
jgi:hypothetical protein